MEDTGTMDNARRIDGDQSVVTPPSDETSPAPLVADAFGTSPLSYNSLLNRPRSNPRSRTPMRYESPLDPDAFRRSNVVVVEEEAPERRSVGRVRPLWAGAAVGAAPRRRVPLEKSSKQGPSKRKIKRWNNDSFRGLAAELAAASPRGPAVAELFLQAHADAASYKSYHDPKPSKALSEFYKQESSVRDEFFRGEIGVVSNSDAAKKKKPQLLTPAFMMSRVHARLQRVLCRLQSSPSTKIIDKFEIFLVQTLGAKVKEYKEEAAVWNDVLVEPPSVVHQKKRQMVRFVFEKEAGLCRLFLHAVCQFHGLQVTSYNNGSSAASGTHCLAVTGVLEGPEYRLMDHLNDMKRLSTKEALNNGEGLQSSVPSLTDTMSSLRVV